MSSAGPAVPRTVRARTDATRHEGTAALPREHAGGVRCEVRLTGIWYVVGFAFAGVSFVIVTIGAAWLISHRNRGDGHKGLPYESGIDTYGDTHGRFGLSFYIYALLFVAFDIEVIFIYLWAIVFRDLLLGGLVSMLVFVAILLLGLAYAWRKGVLTWR